MGNFIYISQVLSLILSEVYYREKVDESSVQDRHVTMVIRFMYENLTRSLTLEEISEEVQLSRSYLNTIFKNQTGRSPVEFFIHLKMQEACKLLKNTNLYIYEVSSRLGYEDQYYFSRIFKKWWACRRKIIRMGIFLLRVGELVRLEDACGRMGDFSDAAAPPSSPPGCKSPGESSADSSPRN